MTQQRPNLKEIRDALNKIPEETLEFCSIAFNGAITDDPTDDFQVLWLDDEENMRKRYDDLAKDSDDVLKMFTHKLNEDLKQARFRENEKGYDEEYNMEGDW